MSCKSLLVVALYIAIFTKSALCWQYFTTVRQLIQENSAPGEETVHSEYEFGDCKRKDIVFYIHKHLDHLEVLGKIIIREWLPIPRIPICIIIRATSFMEYKFRNTGYNFQMCVPRITYCHSGYRYKYFYYEWYLPYDVQGGMNWDLYFYGSPSLFYH